MKDDYETIKKVYGERVARLCREIVPELFEHPGLMPKILEKSFAPHAQLAEDLKTLGKYNVRNYFYSKVNIEEPKLTSNKSVKELLREVGYNIFECETANDILAFKRYYAEDELLCTFRDNIEDRFKECAYFFLYTDKAFFLDRKNYTNPVRDDEYGRSLVCLQIDRDYHFIKMTTRYNHGADLADSMFSNNLDNIAPGLTDAFEREYGYKISQSESVSKEELTELCYVESDEQILYKYNNITNGKCYCPDNTVLDEGEAVQIDKDSKLLLEYIILDFHNKKISLYDKEIEDSFNNQKLQKISVERFENHFLYNLILEDGRSIHIESDLNNRIVGITDSDIEKIEDNYLKYCWNIRKASFPNTTIVGDDFMSMGFSLEEITMPKVTKVGENFLSANRFVKYLDFDNCRQVGNNFMNDNEDISELHMNNLVAAGNYFLNRNMKLRELNLPNVMMLGEDSLSYNESIRKINMPNLADFGRRSFENNFALYEYAERKVVENSMRSDFNVEVEELPSKKHR